MAIYRIEVKERSERPHFMGVYEVEATSFFDAVVKAKQRFAAEYPDRRGDNYSFAAPDTPAA